MDCFLIECDVEYPLITDRRRFLRDTLGVLGVLEVQFVENGTTLGFVFNDPFGPCVHFVTF